MIPHICSQNYPNEKTLHHYDLISQSTIITKAYSTKYFNIDRIFEYNKHKINKILYHNNYTNNNTSIGCNYY